MGKVETSDIELGASAPAKTEERLEQMRKRFEEMIATEPGAIIMMADTGQSVLVAAIGSPLDIKALHQEGTKTLAHMLYQANVEAGEPRPEKLNG